MLKILKIHEKKIYGGLIIFFFSVNFLAWSRVFALASRSDLAVYFFDVGQGDAILIDTKDGTQVLVDGGPTNKILSNLGIAMPYGDNFIDAVMISHPHADHISGLIEVLKKYDVGVVIESGVLYETPEIAELRKIVSEKKIKTFFARSGSRLSFFKGAEIDFLYPDVSYQGRAAKDVNETSLVAMLEYGGRKILFTGDAGKVAESALRKSGALEDVDVLKVGHQGSKYSSTKEFLGEVAPEYAVISVGRNSYGHPSPEALSRLAAAGAKIFRTDLDGTVILEIRNSALIWK